jgi:DNA-binding GntR family transcriptional regulator
MLVHSSASLNVLISLRKDILTRKLLSGTHLKRANLAEQYKVSRGSVSQALYKLEMEGLVEDEGNGRVKVIGISEKDVVDMRLYLEKKAMETLHDKDDVDFSPLITVLKSTNQENSQEEQADPVQMAALGFNIHVAMFEMAGNRAIFHAWKTAPGLIQEIIMINGSHVPVREIYRKHKVLGDCIMQKWENAVEIIEQHLMAGSRDVYLEALRNITKNYISPLPNK